MKQDFASMCSYPSIEDTNKDDISIKGIWDPVTLITFVI